MTDIGQWAPRGGQTVAPATGPLAATVEVPGSKSLANRALVCAGLADGVSTLRGVPAGDDTGAMVEGLGVLGIEVGLEGTTATVAGTGGRIGADGVTVHAGLAGTTSRFLTAVGALSKGRVVVDGHGPLRRRPMGVLHTALTDLGLAADALDSLGHLPVRVGGSAAHSHRIRMAGDVSSQYLSALMMVGPLLPDGLTVELTSPLVSRPYVAMTASVMSAFGISGIAVSEHTVSVEPGQYRCAEFSIEPDASSASYPFAAAAICGGTVCVPGLHRDAVQGDARIVDILEQMGATAAESEQGLTVSRDPSLPLRGISIDMADVSDLVPTVAVVALFARGETHIRGVGFIRAKESDRLGDLAAELVKTGAEVDVTRDGLRVTPRPPHAATFDTHHDHRLAMALSLVGLALPGTRVNTPDVVSKSWPQWWDVLSALACAPDRT